VNKQKSYGLRLVMILLFAWFVIFIFKVNDVKADNSSLNYIYVTTEEELRVAVTTEEAVIVVNTIIQLTEEAVEIDGIITIQGNGSIEVTARFYHFIVNEGAVFILADQLTLGKSSEVERRWDLGGIEVIGTFTMYGGEITDTGRGVRVSSGTFNMYGGKITNTDSGVSVSTGIFNMHGGEISDNSSSGVGISTGIFNMYNGRITNNVNFGDSFNPARGGGVSLWESTFNMYGGLISNNVADNGGGIGATRSIINIHNGEISNNTSEQEWGSNAGGGGIHLENGFLAVYGGEIVGNRSLVGGSGLNLWDSHGMMSDGVIKNNNIQLEIMSTFSIVGGEVSDEIIDTFDRGSFRNPNYFQPYIHGGLAAFSAICIMISMIIFLKKRSRLLQKTEKYDGKGDALS